MKRIWLLIFPFFLVACQEEVFLPLGEKENLVPTIEGIWTDNRIYNEVKISLSKNFYDSLSNQIITDAEVVITIPGTEKVIPFRYIGGTKSYRPVNPFEMAEVGETYQLNVKWRDNIYRSKGVMLEAPTVDSVTWKFEEKRLFREQGYYIKVFGKVPFKQDNNYRIRIIENDTLKNQRDDYLLFDDTFGLQFFERGLELGYAFQENDRVRLELYRLNRDAYDYLNQLVNLLFNDGGLFSPPPQNPQSNIRVVQGRKDVLGYFVVSPILSRTVVIKPN
jgi:hypothetical protein